MCAELSTAPRRVDGANGQRACQSAPVTGAGNLVACMAESLSGLVMAQLKRRGAPVIFGGVPTVIDMSTTLVSYGAPEMHLWSAALTEMAHYLRLPVFSTAGCTDAVAFDQQAAAQLQRHLYLK